MLSPAARTTALNQCRCYHATVKDPRFSVAPLTRPTSANSAKWQTKLGELVGLWFHWTSSLASMIQVKPVESSDQAGKAISTESNSDRSTSISVSAQTLSSVKISKSSTIVRTSSTFDALARASRERETQARWSFLGVDMTEMDAGTGQTTSDVATLSPMPDSRATDGRTLIDRCRSAARLLSSVVVPAAAVAAPTPMPTPTPTFSHVTAEGEARMVDVGTKTISRRMAIAEGSVILTPEIVQLLVENQLKKGDALTVAQVAGVMAAKRTSDLIPLCHNISLNDIQVQVRIDSSSNSVQIRGSASCDAKTGAEMEALTAVSVAALTIYDMCKAVSKEITIGNIRLVQKTGGKSDYDRLNAAMVEE